MSVWSWWQSVTQWARPEPTPIPPAPSDMLGAATLPHVVVPERIPAKQVAVLVRSVLTIMEARDGIRQSPEADMMMVAISGQEAAWKHRNQIVTGKPDHVIGPATGLWQFERGGGVAGVLRHKASATIAMRWCRAESVDASPDAVWRALVVNDRLACVFARLLLLTDPRALPNDQDEAWAYYIRNWRPGKPHPRTWAANWAASKAALS